MSVIPQLAHSLGRRDEAPNKALAKQIAATGNKTAVRELVENLHIKSRDIQHDCIKVLYEIGSINPALIAGYLPDFLLLLSSKNNRMQWSSMCAIDSLTHHNPEAVYAALPRIIDAADKGSVITRDHTVFILIKLCQVKKYSADAFELLLDQLRNCPPNQLPMYAELAIPVIKAENRQVFTGALLARAGEMQTESKRKRIEKVAKKFRL